MSEGDLTRLLGSRMFEDVKLRAVQGKTGIIALMDIKFRNPQTKHPKT